MHCAPQAAYELLKKFYTLLTEREVHDDLQPIQEQYRQDAQDPEYAKATIAKKMKERELARIPDEKVQQDMAKTVITSHNEMLRTDRIVNPDRYKNTNFGRTRLTAQDSQQQSRARGFAASQTGGRSEAEVHHHFQTSGGAADVKQVQVKTANKHIRGLRQAKKDGKGGFAANDDDNDEISLDYVLGDIIGTTLANKMGKNDPEYKNFKESFDQVTTYFIERYTYIQDELVHDIFTELNKRAEDIVGVVSKNMMDFCDLAEFFTSALHKTNPQVTSAGSADADAAEEENIFKLIVDTFSKLGIQILNEDPQ
jgi:hypothetical protein